MNKKIVCPICDQADPVEKVSSLFLSGLAVRKARNKDKGKANAADSALYRELAASPALMAASRKLAPPASGKQITIRPIHPDQAVLFFSLIVPIFLYGMFTTQPGAALAVVAVLAAFYTLYLWQRKPLLVRFERERASQRATNDRIQRGIQRWMRLYYCAEDEVVFEPGKDEAIMVDLMPGYLLREE